MEHMIALLGRVELGRWLSVTVMAVVLLGHASENGRLLAVLAQRSGQPRSQSRFTVGLLSQLGLLLQMPRASSGRRSEPRALGRVPQAGRWAVGRRRSAVRGAERALRRHGGGAGRGREGLGLGGGGLAAGGVTACRLEKQKGRSSTGLSLGWGLRPAITWPSCGG